jgi:hypothetical protein
MNTSSLPIAVVMQRRPLDNPWQSEKWEAVEVRPDHSSAECSIPALMERSEQGDRWLWSGLEIKLHTDEAEGYLLNVGSPEPRVFVCWRMAGEQARPELVTVSYGEASRWIEGSESVDGVPLAPELVPWIRGFAERYYRPETKRKRRKEVLDGG